ncbi:MAG: hypothetical protein ISQ34_05165 [Rickettsiales bacterium]|nr:hypothetical protein [Rickettsiales bacterium]
MFTHLFKFDSLAAIATTLIIFVATIVLSYAKKYLRGDRNQKKFVTLIFLITTSLIITFSTDNIFLLAASWFTNNLLLVQIMVHKKTWQQSLASGRLALKNFILGFTFLTIALTSLYLETRNTSIHSIINYEDMRTNTAIFASVFLFLAAMTQCALFPFQSWLISSLNSPTPSSAIMHAGLVNGGGLLLARFSEILIQAPLIMHLFFTIALLSAIIGTLWKLIQSNIKAMLASSTMSQMGFMICQCAMGLFPAAIAHLFWHGMFKSYLFLSSAGVVKEKRLDLGYPPKISAFLTAVICGLVGMTIFAYINRIDLILIETTLFIAVLAFIIASQIALVIINDQIIKNFIPALVISALASGLYALSIEIIEHNLNTQLFHPLPLNIFHISALVILISMWIARIFLVNANKKPSAFFQKYYVKLLNASQAHSSTITSNRNLYNN